MRPRSTTTRRLEEAKLGVVHRFGEALREISRRHQDRTGPAYEEIFDIGCGNDSYPVRLAIAQEIGIGGNEAFRILCYDHTDPWGAYPSRAEELRRAEMNRAGEDEPKYQKLRISGVSGTSAHLLLLCSSPHGAVLPHGSDTHPMDPCGRSRESGMPRCRRSRFPVRWPAALGRNHFRSQYRRSLHTLVRSGPDVVWRSRVDRKSTRLNSSHLG